MESLTALAIVTNGAGSAMAQLFLQHYRYIFDKDPLNVVLKEFTV